jgi:lipoyl(octanoyl) transferase
VRDDLWIVRCGLVPYEAAREAQARLAAARQADEVPDLLLLLEHPPVYTRGRRTQASELPMGEDWYRAQGIEVCDTDRGGAVTYHGPGQLVGYPIVSLKPYGDDVHAYVRRIEQVMIEALGGFGVEAQTIDHLTGVWTSGAAPAGGAHPGGEARKIGSIGVHISRGVTTHGFAINVNNDLQPFEWIVPCGIEGCRVTSLGRELGGEQDLAQFGEEVAERFASAYERSSLPIEPAQLAGHVGGIESLIEVPAAATAAEAALR